METHDYIVDTKLSLGLGRLRRSREGESRGAGSLETNDQRQLMKHILTIAVLLLASPAASQAAERHIAWPSKQAPLMTKWAAQVDPGQPLPEYPRPQMVRSRWLNMNGPWEFSAAAKDETVPTGKTLPERIQVPFVVESPLSGLMRHEERMWYRHPLTSSPGIPSPRSPSRP